MNDLINRKTVTKVKNYLNKFDQNIELIVLDETARTAIDAANSLKTEVGSIVKSLLFKDMIIIIIFVLFLETNTYPLIKYLN